jgi:hypothetical protein
MTAQRARDTRLVDDCFTRCHPREKRQAMGSALGEGRIVNAPVPESGAKRATVLMGLPVADRVEREVAVSLVRFGEEWQILDYK